MTIILHWWAIPVALALLGLFVGSRDRGGFDIVPLFGMLVLFACAIGIIVGHYISVL